SDVGMQGMAVRLLACSYQHNGTRWNCTSANPDRHWTNDNERYCYNDWQQIVKAIKARGNIIVTDPLTVGKAFGRPSAYPERGALGGRGQAHGGFGGEGQERRRLLQVELDLGGGV